MAKDPLKVFATRIEPENGAHYTVQPLSFYVWPVKRLERNVYRSLLAFRELSDRPC